MKYLLPALILVSTPVIAQPQDLYNKCMRTAITQLALDLCASQEAARSDKELNDVYRKLLSEIGDQHDVTAKVMAMERVWIAYRDQYMAAMYPAKDKQAEYGSMYPMEADILLAKLTREHVNALKSLLRQYGPADR
ncbi:MAG: DUF1311 domain-containing protein [Proteobacteria bacterium]|nr:DUF1311 domain-containing protein [Pseudomonadota bacterium]